MGGGRGGGVERGTARVAAPRGGGDAPAAHKTSGNLFYPGPARQPRPVPPAERTARPALPAASPSLPNKHQVAPVQSELRLVECGGASYQPWRGGDEARGSPRPFFLRDPPLPLQLGLSSSQRAPAPPSPPFCSCYSLPSSPPPCPLPPAPARLRPPPSTHTTSLMRLHVYTLVCAARWLPPKLSAWPTPPRRARAAGVWGPLPPLLRDASVHADVSTAALCVHQNNVVRSEGAGGAK